LAERFSGQDFKLVNDSWAAFRAGSAASFGAVSVCGTGANAAARNPEGKQAALRSLGYECGNWGGAFDLTREALHHAFRSNEGTGPRTRLEEAVLGLFNGIGDYDTLAYQLREDFSLKYRAMSSLPCLVFQFAGENDPVAQDILARMGAVLGADCAAVIKMVGMENMPCEVVMAGGMFAAARQYNPLLADAFSLALHRAAPYARPIPLRREPAAGAYLLALEEAGQAAGEEIEAALDLSLRSIGGILPSD
ncbi:MAG: hypothetical protein AB1767_05385, partial [Bacillota bacterium]